MTVSHGQYKIEIYNDPTFSNYSSDNITDYISVYSSLGQYSANSFHGIKIYKENHFLKSAGVAASGGGTGVHENSFVIGDDRIMVCCSDTVFCLSIPDLCLIWQTKADTATCFEIFKLQDNYIVHGELEITKLDKDGNIIWQNMGADIFTTLDGKDNFIITDKYILATDWENREYKFDFDGKTIK
jgi:hypothetical protein